MSPSTETPRNGGWPDDSARYPFLGVFRACLFLLCLISFSALASTGEIAPTAILLGYSAFALASLRHRIAPILPSHGVWTLMTVAVFGSCAWYVVREDVINGIVYFLIYLQFQKLLIEPRNRDYLQLVAISFFQMVGAATMTVSISYGFWFLLYLAVGVASLALLTCKRDGDLAESEREESRPRGFWLARMTPRSFRDFGGMAAVAFAATIVFFILIPRLSGKNFFFYMQGSQTDALSGFSDTVEFGALEPIKMDSAIVMRVYPRGEDRPSHLRLRGTSLSNFDGRRWTRMRPDREFLLPDQGFYGYAEHVSERPKTFRQNSTVLNMRVREADVELEPNVTRYLFVPDVPKSVRLPAPLPVKMHPDSGSLHLVSVLRTKLEYDVAWEEWNADLATLKELSLQTRRTSTSTYEASTEGSRHDLQLPDDLQNSQRLRNLAGELTEGPGTRLDKARTTERWLRENFEYSLDPASLSTGRFVEDFLFESRAGHCEYFASSMVVLCRLAGIPARIVTGFYTDEYNPMGRHFVVRQQHAHSWVEVFDEGLGWITFDPTPPEGVGSGRGMRSQWLMQIDYILDAVKVRWYAFVVDYNFWRQRNVYDRLGRMLGTVTDVELPTAGTAGGTAVGALFLLLLAALGGGLFYVLSRARRAPSDPFSTLWLQLRRRLAKRLSLSAPLDLLTDRDILRAANANLPQLDGLGRAVHLHERVAYGGRAPDPAELEWLAGLVKRLG